MKVLKKKLTLNTFDYYMIHFDIINVFIPEKITKKEKEILAHFLSLEVSIHDRFTASSKKVIMEKLGLSDGGLSNHLKALKKKNLIYKQGNNIYISDFILPNEQTQSYNFTLTHNA